MPIPFNAQGAFAAAHAIAESQEEVARAMLWDRVSEKAQESDAFRKALAENPQQAVKTEAERLMDAGGGKIEIAPAVVEKVAAKARETYSSIVPELASAAVEELIFGTIRDVKRAYTITLLLSQVMFYAGLGMVVAGFIAALFGQDKWVSLFFGTGGLASMLISSLVVSPLDRVQTAAGNLVQLQMAYLGYYKQLYLLGGNNATLTREDALAYAKEIDRVTVSLMGSVKLYVERGAAPNSGKPPAPPAGTTARGARGAAASTAAATTAPGLTPAHLPPMLTAMPSAHATAIAPPTVSVAPPAARRRGARAPRLAAVKHPLVPAPATVVEPDKG